MNDRVKELVNEVLSFDEVTRKEFEVELRTGKKELTSQKKELSKKEKEDKKLIDTENGKKKVNETGIDGTIRVTYKDGTIDGRIVKIGEKTFTINFVDDNGDEKNLFRYYSNVVIEDETIEE